MAKWNARQKITRRFRSSKALKADRREISQEKWEQAYQAGKTAGLKAANRKKKNMTWGIGNLGLR